MGETFPSSVLPYTVIELKTSIGSWPRSMTKLITNISLFSVSTNNPSISKSLVLTPPMLLKGVTLP